MRAILLLLSARILSAQQFPFEVKVESEVVALLEMSSANSDWAVTGKEAAVANVRAGDSPEHQVILWAGESRHVYRVVLGRFPAGKHSIRITRNDKYSRAACTVFVNNVRFEMYDRGSSEFDAFASMPYLYARLNTIGKFSDVPLMAYYERIQEHDEPILQYTVIFSNEDGGTSTRALMARWGRTTDIEYIYRVYRSTGRATVQGPDHKELNYTGKKEERHALLMPVTDNNMVAEANGSPLRFQIAPVFADLSHRSREQVMDAEPAAYSTMGKELQREGKLRDFGQVREQTISDPRNYLSVDYGATHEKSAFTVAVHLTDGRAFTSDLGRLDYAIGRNGWVRTTVELPPGTTRSQISGIEFRCSVGLEGKALAHSGTCTLLGVNQAFFLGQDWSPSASFWSVQTPVKIPSGQSVVMRP